MASERTAWLRLVASLIAGWVLVEVPAFALGASPTLLACLGLAGPSVAGALYLGFLWMTYGT